MRHGSKINHLGRKTPHRKALLRNLACQLIQHKRIVTTLAKAKALRVFVEPILTKSKEDSTHQRRVVFSYLQDKEAIKELFGEVSSKIANRPGGYCRIIKLERRVGDAADMAMIELVDFNEIYNVSTSVGEEKKKTRRGRAKKTADDSETPKAPKAKAPKANSTEEVVESVEEVVAEASVSDAPIVEVAADAPATEETPMVADSSTSDDLTKIEGIGPKIAELFNNSGITTFAKLAASNAEDLKNILTEAGSNFASHDPTTWPQQSQMAAEGKMDELKAWQDELKGGKEA